MIRRILRNFSWLSVATVFELGLGMVVTAILARRLGPDGFGQFSLWLAFIAFFTPLYDFGLTAFSLREVAQNPSDAAHYLKAVIMTKIRLSMLGLLVIFGVAYGLKYFSSLISAVAFGLLAVSQILHSFALLNRAVFRAREWMHLQAYVEVTSNLLRLLLILTVILVRPNLVFVCMTLAVVNLGEFILSSIVIRIQTRKQSLPSIPHSKKYDYQTTQLLKRSTPFALYDMLNGMYMRADVVLLGTIGGVQAVGWYSSAYKLATFVGLIPRTLMEGIYPILCKESPVLIYQLVRRLLIVFLVIAFPVCLSLTILAPEIIGLVYGTQYGPAIAALQILAWASFSVFGGSLLLATLNALYLEHTVVRIMGVVAGIGLAAFAISIPEWGFIGASLVSSGIEAALLLLMLVAVSRRFSRSLLSFRMAISLCAMYTTTAIIAYVLGQSIGKIVGLVIAIIAYSLASLYMISKISDISALFRDVTATGLMKTVAYITNGQNAEYGRSEHSDT